MSPRDFLTGWLLIAALCSASAAAAQAEESEDAAGNAAYQALPRYLGMISAGLPLRLAPKDDFGQDAFGPAFTDVLGGYVFPSSASIHHGVGLGASLNLGDDGGYAEPVYSAEQLVIMPAYLMYLDMGQDWFGLGHLGVPVMVTNGGSAGAELAFAIGYRVLAGTGLFTELSADAFGGAGALNPTLALELGLFLNYEVLP
jgi:hypothetical protein